MIAKPAILIVILRNNDGTGNSFDSSRLIYKNDGINTKLVYVDTVGANCKAEYDGIYAFARVRQIICYSKTGKVLYRSDDDTSAGWDWVNASDPVGIVGEYLGR